MPYEIVLVPNSKPKRYRVYNPEKGKYFSNRGLKYETALRQQKALYANANPHLEEGEGIRDALRTANRVVRRLVSGQDDLPPRFQSFIDRNGNVVVKSATLVREPVQKMIQLLLNLLSQNKFQSNVDKLGYDTIYHLSLDLQLENGVNAKLEKNERISISEKKYQKGSQTLPIAFPHITLNEALQNTQKLMGSEFLTYSAHNNNCQKFILSILKANNCSTPAAEEFINQDAKSLFEGLPTLQRIAHGITDLGSKVDTIVQGGKITKSKKSKKTNYNIDANKETMVARTKHRKHSESEEMQAEVVPKMKGKGKVKELVEKFDEPKHTHEPEVKPEHKPSEKRKLTEWTSFCKQYYHDVAKPKGQTYKEMLQDPSVKKLYLEKKTKK